MMPFYRKPHALLVWLFVAAVVVAFAFAIANYRGASQEGAENYFFFMQFYSKDLGPANARHYAPFTGCFHGHNIFLFDGCDGAAGLDKGVHFEPVKYLISVLYTVTRTPLAISAFYILIYFSPLFYASFLARKRPEYGWLLFGSMLAYALYPGSIITAITALRPMEFFYPCLTLFMLSVFLRRSNGEKFGFLNALLFAREDSLILSLPGIAYEWWREYRTGEHHRTSSYMALNWLAWAFVEFIYFAWAKSAFVFHVPIAGTFARILLHHPLLATVGAILAIGCAVLILFYAWQTHVWEWSHFGSAVVIAVPLSITLILLIMGWSAFPWTSAFIYGRIGTLITVLTLIAIIGVVTSEMPTWNMRWSQAAIAVIVVVFLASDFIGGNSLLTKFNTYRHAATDAALLFTARHDLPRSAGIVVDYDSSQLFYDFNDVVVLNGFNYHPRSNEPLFKPNTSSEFETRLKQDLTYAVVSSTTLGDLKPLVANAGKHLQPIELNQTYGLYKIY